MNGKPENQSLHHEARPTEIKEPWQPRFGIGMMLLIMLIASVMASGGFYAVRYFNTRGLGNERAWQMAFILLTVAAPVVLLVIVSLAHKVIAWLGGRK